MTTVTIDLHTIITTIIIFLTFIIINIFYGKVTSFTVYSDRDGGETTI